MSNANDSPTKSTMTLPESSNWLDSSEATAPSPSSSTAKERSTSTAATPEQNILYQDRIFVTGMTGSGKSELAKQLFLAMPGPRLIVDPADSKLTKSIASENGTFRDPNRVPDVATARFVPSDPEDRDAYDALYRWIFNHYPRAIWLDEAGVAAPATGYPRALNTVVVQGRKRQIFHMACHTRPREICKNLIAQASHTFIFDLPNADDRRYVADTIGIKSAVLEREMNRLPEYGFLWHDQRAKTLAVCPPLKLK